MSHPGEGPTEVAMRFIGQQLETLRVTMHDELAAMRNDFTVLATDVRSQVRTIAVLEHRVGEHDRDISELAAKHDKDIEEFRRARQEEHQRAEAHRRNRNLAIAIAIISALVTIVGTVLTLTLGG